MFGGSFPSRRSHAVASCLPAEMPPLLRDVSTVGQVPALLGFAPHKIQSFQTRVGVSTFLSWDSPEPTDPLAEIMSTRAFSPPSTSTQASTPSSTSLRPIRLRGTTLVNHGPTSRFRTASPVYSAWSLGDRDPAPVGARFASLLHLAADPGVRPVYVFCRVVACSLVGPLSRVAAAGHSDEDIPVSFAPLEEFPLPLAVPCHQGRFLHDVRFVFRDAPPYVAVASYIPWAPIQICSSPRRFSNHKSVPSTAICRLPLAYPSWVYFPFKALRFESPLS